MKQKQVERILEDRIDIPGIAKELLAAGGVNTGDGLSFQQRKNWIKDTLLSLDVERILEDRIDIPGIAKELLAAAFVISAKKKGVNTGAGFLSLLRSPKRFQKLKDGWIKDTLLSLDWGPSSDKRMNWEDAKKYCAKEGGRLPEIDELVNLADRSKYKPAIDPIFTDTQSDSCWSGTTYAGDTDLAWYVCFYDGYVGSDGKTTGDYVRPVRSSQ